MDITNEIVTSFRTFFTGFEDVEKWPDQYVFQALNEAAMECGGKCWGTYVEHPQNFKRQGMFYFAAAWLSSNFGDKGTSNGISSTSRLNVGAKSIADESVTYRTPSMMGVDNDYLTYTSFGQQFYRLRKRASMGAHVC